MIPKFDSTIQKNFYDHQNMEFSVRIKIHFMVEHRKNFILFKKHFYTLFFIPILMILVVPSLNFTQTELLNEKNKYMQIYVKFPLLMTIELR